MASHRIIRIRNVIPNIIEIIMVIDAHKQMQSRGDLVAEPFFTALHLPLICKSWSIWELPHRVKQEADLWNVRHLFWMRQLQRYSRACGHRKEVKSWRNSEFNRVAFRHRYFSLLLISALAGRCLIYVSLPPTTGGICLILHPVVDFGQMALNLEKELNWW